MHLLYCVSDIGLHPKLTLSECAFICVCEGEGESVCLCECMPSLMTYMEYQWQLDDKEKLKM